jgi:hypothetical protein
VWLRQVPAARGSLTVNAAPLPAPSLWAVDRSAMQLDEMAHDRQTQAEAAFGTRARRIGLAGSARTRAEGTPVSIPRPVSVTRMTASLPAASTRIVTCPPSGVNLIAFERRFHATCCSRAASAATGPSRGSTNDDKPMFLPRRFAHAV